VVALIGILWSAMVARGERGLLCCFFMQVMGGEISRYISWELILILWTAMEARRGEASAF
jgi:hypothetical protein